MSLFVHFDHTGHIRGFVTVNGPEDSGMSLALKPGIQVAEVEGVKVSAGPAAIAELRELAKKQVVKAPPQRVTLRKK
jgi:hypothetical protein